FSSICCSGDRQGACLALYGVQTRGASAVPRLDRRSMGLGSFRPMGSVGFLGSIFCTYIFVVPACNFVYIQDMELVWDEPKRLTNRAKHGMDFVDLDLTSFEAATIYPGNYGRLVAVGEFGGIITVVFIELGTEALSIISKRPASRK